MLSWNLWETKRAETFNVFLPPSEERRHFCRWMVGRKEARKTSPFRKTPRHTLSHTHTHTHAHTLHFRFFLLNFFVALLKNIFQSEAGASFSTTRTNSIKRTFFVIVFGVFFKWLWAELVHIDVYINLIIAPLCKIQCFSTRPNTMLHTDYFLDKLASCVRVCTSLLPMRADLSFSISVGRHSTL